MGREGRTDDEANDSYTERRDDVPGSLLLSVRVPSSEEGADGGEDEGGSTEEEGDSVGVAEGSSDLGEELVERQADDHGGKAGPREKGK
jgi:hypothetical protein